MPENTHHLSSSDGENKKLLQKLDEINAQINPYLATKPLEPGQNPKGLSVEEFENYRRLLYERNDVLTKLTQAKDEPADNQAS